MQVWQKTEHCVKRRVQSVTIFGLYIQQHATSGSRNWPGCILNGTLADQSANEIPSSEHKH